MHLEICGKGKAGYVLSIINSIVLLRQLVGHISIGTLSFMGSRRERLSLSENTSQAMASCHESSPPSPSRRRTEPLKEETRDDMSTFERSDTVNSTQVTQYVKMLKDEAQMETGYNIRVSAANWALLAGYLVIPGTFTSLQKSSQVEEALSNNKAGRVVMHTIQNPPLLVISCLFFVGAIIAMCFLIRVRKIRSCYTWLINKFLT